MRKEDVEFHSDAFQPAHAAVNVKIHGWRELTAAELEQVAEDCGVPEGATAAEFASWYLADTPERRHQREEVFPEWATEDGWTQLREVAKEIWGAAADVYSEGRSGGWAVVAAGEEPEGYRQVSFTREDVAGWDAIALGRWARFCKFARAIVADLPNSAAVLACINPWTAEMEERETARRGGMFYDVAELEQQQQRAGSKTEQSGEVTL